MAFLLLWITFYIIINVIYYFSFSIFDYLIGILFIIGFIKSNLGLHNLDILTQFNFNVLSVETVRMMQISFIVSFVDHLCN